MPAQSDGTEPTQEERSKRQERADRILDAAAELILRWGVRKTTIDNIARYAGVAKGTIYLHWKTREDLLLAVLLRERINAGKDLGQRLASDPDGATLHSVMKHTFLSAMENPLIKAVMLRDTEVLGELAHSEFGRMDYQQRFEATRGYLDFLHGKGLLRTDIDVRAKVQMLSAITIGFLLVNQFLTEEYQIGDEEAAELLSETVHRTFELRDPTPSESREATETFNHVLDIVSENTQKELEL